MSLEFTLFRVFYYVLCYFFLTSILFSATLFISLNLRYNLIFLTKVTVSCSVCIVTNFYILVTYFSESLGIFPKSLIFKIT